MIDSGTSTYITPLRAIFINFKQCVLLVSTTTSDLFYTKGYRDIILQLLNQDQTNILLSLTLKKVQLALKLKSSLISISALNKEDIRTQTKNSFITFKYQDTYSIESIIGFAIQEGEHYQLNYNSINKVKTILDYNFSLLTGSPNSVFTIKRGSPIAISVDLAHRYIYYTSEDYIKKIEIYIDRIILKPGSSVIFLYTPYIKGKGHTLPFSKVRSIRSKPGEFIHLNVQGPISIISYSREYYFITFTNDTTRFTQLFLLKSRAKVIEKFIQLESYLKTQFSFTIKKVYSDNTPKYKPLTTYLSSRGVIQDPTPLYIKQLNSVAKIKNRHLIEPLIAVITKYQL